MRVYRARRDHQTLRFDVKEPGEIDMVSRALATLDLVTHDNAQPAFPAVLSHGELAGLGGGRLAGYKIPKHFMFVDQVPRSAAGKIQRWRLASPHENGATLP
jgi:acyl-CoA synthetase (AMP-forming)/AMP-acid ligase II